MAEQGFRKWIIVITVITAAVIELIDVSIVNVALSDMSATLGATIEDIAWVITAYAIANVIVIPMTSFLGGLFGRRNYYTFSILLFTAASFFCGHSSTLAELVFFRFMQGLGGGALLSTSQSILFDTFSVEERPLAAGIFGLGVVIGPTIGPTLGGWIVDNFTWPWIFFVNIPIGITAAILAYTFVKEPKHERTVSKIDWPGIGLLVAGIASLQYVLERGETEDWFDSRTIVILAVISVISLVAFVWRELTTEHPVVELHVLKSRTLAFCAFLTFIIGFGLFSSVFIIPVFAQRLLGYDAMQTGLLLLPGAIVTLFVLPWVGRIQQKGMPAQIMIFVGFTLTALYTYLLSRISLDAGWWTFFGPLVIRGIGLPLCFVPITTLAVSGLHPRDIPQGVALNNMMRQLGGSFGIAIVTTYLAHRIGINRVALLSHVTQYGTATQQRLNMLIHGFVAKGSTLAVAKQQAYAALDGTVMRQTMVKSYLDVFVFVTIFFVLCLPLILTIRKGNAPVSAEMASAH
ncbi:MAG: DHA2 family efflux MFS transporter permease subunit [Bacteroidota bacterium]|nr:DHA2 family efflux MFS transporter permease subunit [Bacteroidota bacterium]MDP4233613.1 DHA2 family efflux MFS transporter permease subunit [Bacteroidota bacterium]MDP4243127.1 DHA2 family efflux MFS transporter permease subunit [Bacteroidota bacterium]MDP4288541.1 DHA2 family efflux MFS transporter permease subunit [Bacteroidota bacterium]